MKTTLITGASEGIGLEFARLFAQKGNNLILVARNRERLETIATELSAYKIDVKIYSKDLSVLDNARFVYEDLKKQNISVDYVINNAGFGINGLFVDIDWQKEMEMYNLNMITLAYFTKMFASDMVKRKSGKILNVASTASFQPGPYMAGYCASKAFVLSLSEAINYELRGTNVTVTTLCPGVTDSKFHIVAQTLNTNMTKSFSHATSKEVAEYGISLMMNGTSMGIHGFLNRVVVFSNRVSPRKMVLKVSANILKSNV